jgi:hypothetical protein
MYVFFGAEPDKSDGSPSPGGLWVVNARERGWSQTKINLLATAHHRWTRSACSMRDAGRTCGNVRLRPWLLQSLVLLTARTRAKAFAKRLASEAGDDTSKRLMLAFKLVSGRAPLQEERLACEKFLETQRLVYGKEKDADDRAWADLCQMLLASNAFLYLE